MAPPPTHILPQTSRQGSYLSRPSSASIRKGSFSQQYQARPSSAISRRPNPGSYQFAQRHPTNPAMQRPSTASASSSRRGPSQARQLYGALSSTNSNLTTVAPSVPATLRPKSASRHPPSFAQHDNNMKVRVSSKGLGVGG